jgi:hypothetical protein
MVEDVLPPRLCRAPPLPWLPGAVPVLPGGSASYAAEV